jgi:DNA-binding response OmpR family regulator
VGIADFLVQHIRCSVKRGSAMRLLIIDHDCDLVEMLIGWLKTLGYEVYRAYTGEQARTEWIEHEPDLVLIDTALKGVDVLALCKEMRNDLDALVLVMTDGKDVQDEIRCLESGADDYMRKPFFPAQLLARIHALSRRTRSSLEQRSPSVITIGPLFIDTLHNQVSVHGRVSRLTPTEGKLLHFLAINVGEVCTSDQIVTHVWGYNREGDACLIKAHIYHIRKKIEAEPDNPRYVITFPGVGYMLARNSSETSSLTDRRSAG